MKEHTVILVIRELLKDEITILEQEQAKLENHLIITQVVAVALEAVVAEDLVAVTPIAEAVESFSINCINNKKMKGLMINVIF